MSSRSSVAGPSRSNSSNESVQLVQSKLKGDSPVFDDWGSIAVDHQREKIYMYGGVRPGDKRYLPTNYFHCLDLKAHQW
ncbi:hypothetical protein B0H12DRAFT_829009 [Mycena haematopus]|nr:hypothetical protein B0H12DRAFT_829009 [Mycena haematopus]